MSIIYNLDMSHSSLYFICTKLATRAAITFSSSVQTYPFVSQAKIHKDKKIHEQGTINNNKKNVELFFKKTNYSLLPQRGACHHLSLFLTKRGKILM